MNPSPCRMGGDPVMFRLLVRVTSYRQVRKLMIPIKRLHWAHFSNIFDENPGGRRERMGTDVHWLGYSRIALICSGHYIE